MNGLTPEAVAIITFKLMLIPFIICFVAVITSILIGHYLNNANSDTSSTNYIKLNVFSEKVLYIAFLCIGVMQITFAVLLLTAVWAAVSWILNLLAV